MDVSRRGRGTAPLCAPASPRALGWAVATIAFLFQALLLATHIHPAPRLSATDGIVWTMQVDKADRHHRHEATGDCAICDAQQVAGHILPPTPLLFALPTILAFALVAIRTAPRALSICCHHWRSRAPPFRS